MTEDDAVYDVSCGGEPATPLAPPRDGAWRDTDRPFLHYYLRAADRAR